jgi:uncharacterized protein YcnI
MLRICRNLPRGAYPAIIFMTLAFGWARAGAHVRIFPDVDASVVSACSFSKFIIRVPTEKPLATTAVRVAIPRDVIVYATQAKPGWRAAFSRDKGRIATITWSGGRIEKYEFDEFAFLAGTPKVARSLNWDADQTYEDGSVVRWNGNAGTETPHSQTTVVASEAACRAATAGSRKGK